MINKNTTTIAIAAVLSLYAFLPACSKKKAAVMPGVPVTVATVTQKSVPFQITDIGNVVAYASVDVAARVGGELMKAYFDEGQFMRKGQPMLLIDPRPYKIALEQAQANLQRDEAQLEYDTIELKRYTKLVAKDYVTQEQYDQIHMQAQALSATVAMDKATIDNAKLQLSFCYIDAPVSGRTGILFIKPGNMVNVSMPSNTVLVNMQQTEPIYVQFTAPEQYLAAIKEHQRKGSLKVTATFTESSGGIKTETGKLVFIDNRIDTQTGTITLKALFNNKNEALWPGQFVNVSLTLKDMNAIVIPSQAIEITTKGQNVFVVGKDNTAESKEVVSNYSYDGDSVIEKGLSPGEMVVTDGQLMLLNGTKVEIKK